MNGPDERIEARAVFDFVAHEAVDIEGSASRIWPLILRPDAWKRGITLTHVSGPANEPGAVFSVDQVSLGVLYYVQSIEVIKLRRWTIKLLAGKEGVSLGYASWALIEHGDMTTVTYDVYAQVELGGKLDPDAALGTPAEWVARYQSRESTRFKDELKCLKRLVENHSID